MKFEKKSSTYLIFVIIAVVLILAGFFFFNSDDKRSGKVVDKIVFKEKEVLVTEDGLRYTVDPDLLIGGGPPKDGIPSLDNPSFVSVSEANDWIRDDALVLALDYKGEKRVYPLQIMTWHEIVNENIAGDSLLITYCPLCGSGIAYERTIEINGNLEEVEFGTSGKLYNSNLVMYDRKTDTYWTQIGGEAIIGELAGQELKPVSLDTVEWGIWKTANPESKVLSKETGFVRDYTNPDGPYSNYFANDFQLFPGIQNKDENRKLANKEFVYGIEINGNFKAYPKKIVEEEKIIFDKVGETNIRVEQLEDGKVVVTNIGTGEEIVKEVDFWFAWFAFHPETEVYLN